MGQLSPKQRACLQVMEIEVYIPRVPRPVAEPILDQPIADRRDTPSGSSRVSQSTAALPADWQTLQATVSQCQHCALHTTRTQTVFGVGNRHARLMFIGEAPGADEDRQGEPFVGRAGQLLNAMLQAIRIARHDVYIANILKCRPPNNRDPKPEEAAECYPYLLQQITLIQPRLLVALGRVAAQRLLKTDTALGRLRQVQHQHADSGLPLIVTYHPAYLLRSPQDKRKAWDDLLYIQTVLQNLLR